VKVTSTIITFTCPTVAGITFLSSDALFYSSGMPLWTQKWHAKNVNRKKTAQNAPKQPISRWKAEKFYGAHCVCKLTSLQVAAVKMQMFMVYFLLYTMYIKYH